MNSKNKDLEGLEVEEIQITNSNINMPEARDEIFNKEFVILSNEKFKELVGNLPIIARNHLNNGESKNLWYEEIVPRESMFYFGIDMGIEDNSIKLFDEIIKDLVYIGGNVTVGYGACQIKELKG